MSFERHVYKPVDDRILSQAVYISKTDQKELMQQRVEQNEKFQICLPFVAYRLQQYTYGKKFDFKIRWVNQKFPMSTASMSRQTIAAYFGLYLKNSRKNDLMRQRFNKLMFEGIHERVSSFVRSVTPHLKCLYSDRLLVNLVYKNFHFF